LVVEEENTTIAKARELVNRSRLEVNSANQQQQLLQIIETILVYKFSNMSREEIAAMFEIADFKQTRFYQESKKEVRQEVIQEVKQEFKLETVPNLLSLGLTVEQVAQALDLEIEQVRQIAQQQQVADSDG
jgi:predicted transposase/invertase (TIGR01784 family)